MVVDGDDQATGLAVILRDRPGARHAAERKRLAAAPLVRCDTLEEGLSVQALHVGSYDEEGPLIDQLHRTYLPAHNLTPNGKHHEVYLNDPRKTDPAKLKTVLRQPVVAHGG